MIAWKNEPGRTACCPACGARDHQTLLLDVTSPLTGDTLSLYTCSGCGSHFYDPFVPFESDNLYTDRHIQYYVEVGAGIGSILQPLVSLRLAPGSRRFLEVGCGFGFALDFATHVLGWSAVGVEPSRMGAAGKAALGAAISNDYLENIPALKAARLDVVFTSEVLEHVGDPAAFVEMLASRLAPGGVLILGTPNAEMVSPGTNAASLMGILSPHFHTVLFSEKGLRQLLDRFAFEHVHVGRSGHQLIAHASHRPFRLEPLPRRDPLVILKYMMDAAGRLAGQGAVMIGFLYRAMIGATNLGLFPLGASIGPSLRRAVSAAYGLDLDDLAAVAARLKATTDFEDLGGRLPYCLFGIYYGLGMAALHVEKNPARAIGCFDLGFTACQRFLDISLENFPEAAHLLWSMRLQGGVARIKAGDAAGARRAFEEICAAETDPSPYRGIAPPPHVLEQARAMG
ncbi:class I SAM-dependent methyltransferase [Desulfolutivibrio sp.]|uniref:class I SAM-dependent methyltransferase n=1 Tax=Desulfolutivibrio sp. TaxID=2773296 RepID=UPI002F9687E2